jgi:hypothetical protein
VWRVRQPLIHGIKPFFQAKKWPPLHVSPYWKQSIFLLWRLLQMYLTTASRGFPVLLIPYIVLVVITVIKYDPTEKSSTFIIKRSLFAIRALGPGKFSVYMVLLISSCYLGEVNVWSSLEVWTDRWSHCSRVLKKKKSNFFPRFWSCIMHCGYFSLDFFHEISEFKLFWHGQLVMMTIWESDWSCPFDRKKSVNKGCFLYTYPTRWVTVIEKHMTWL